MSNIGLREFWIDLKKRYSQRLSLSSTEAPAGYPNKNSNNRKIARARGRWDRSQRAFFFPFPQSPYDTDTSTEERRQTNP